MNTLKGLTANTNTLEPESISEGADFVWDLVVEYSKKLMTDTSLPSQKPKQIRDDPDFSQYNDIPSIESTDSKLTKKAKALKLLHVAAYEEGHHGALGALGDIYLFSHFNIVRNASTSFSHYLHLSDLGNATGYMMVGLMHSTGLGTPRDYTKGLVYTSFAVLDGYEGQGSPESAFKDDSLDFKTPTIQNPSRASSQSQIQASHILGYWHHAGIGVEKSCEKSTWYYEKVADYTIESYRTGAPNGLAAPRWERPFSETNGGIYGIGASGSGDASKRAASRKGLRDTDILMLYRLQAESGDATAQVLNVLLSFQSVNTTI